MPVRTCTECNKIFNSSASYRNHKSLFHRPIQQPEEPENEATENTVAGEAQEPKEEPKESDRGWTDGDDSWAWILGVGAAAIVVLYALFGKR